MKSSRAYFEARVAREELRARLQPADLTAVDFPPLPSCQERAANEEFGQHLEAGHTFGENCFAIFWYVLPLSLTLLRGLTFIKLTKGLALLGKILLRHYRAILALELFFVVAPMEWGELAGPMLGRLSESIFDFSPLRKLIPE